MCGAEGGDGEQQLPVAGVEVSPADPLRAMVFTTGNTVYVTKDGGKSFKMRETPMGLHDVKANPGKPRVWLASAFSESCYGRGEGDCKRTLYVSENSGKSWKTAMHYVIDYAWGACDTCVVVSAHKVEKGHQFQLPVTEALVVYTQDLFAHVRGVRRLRMTECRSGR